MYNDTLVYKAVIWVFLLVIVWKEKTALTSCQMLAMLDEGV